MLLRIETICFDYKSVNVLDNVTFEVRSGEVLGIMGPNGSGKTTLLRCVTQVLKPRCGTVLIDRQHVRSLSRREIAQTMGVVPQTSAVDFAFTVFEIVMMGRTPHLGTFGESARDYAIVRKAMELTNTLHLSDRIFEELSGGEKQRAIIARALAQQPRILLLDEPTIHLDIGCQFDILGLVKRLSIQEDIAVLSVFHDLNLASQFCDNLLLLDNGRIVSAGQPKDVLTPENIKKTYGIDAFIQHHPLTNTLSITPYISPKNERKKSTVHVVCGGGSGSQLMNLLSQDSFTVTTGVLNVFDSDFETARTLHLTVIGEIPFSQITQESAEANVTLAKKAEIVVLTDFPVGFGNLKNIEAVEAALDAGTKVIVIHSTPFEEKDFTEGAFRAYFTRLEAKGAHVVKSVPEAFALIEHLSRR